MFYAHVHLYMYVHDYVYDYAYDYVCVSVHAFVCD